jgi:acetyl esterase/lipase
VPLQDAQRVMRLIRARASRDGVDPAKLGIVGFSAGGLLAASLAVAHADPVYAKIDAADEGSARPAYAGLVYPVISGDTMRVGKNAAARFDTDRRVRQDAPPISSPMRSMIRSSRWHSRCRCCSPARRRRYR